MLNSFLALDWQWLICEDIFVGNVQIEGTYINMFCDKVNQKTMNTLVEITKFIEEYINQRRVL